MTKTIKAKIHSYLEFSLRYYNESDIAWAFEYYQRADALYMTFASSKMIKEGTINRWMRDIQESDALSDWMMDMWRIENTIFFHLHNNTFNDAFNIA